MVMVIVVLLLVVAVVQHRRERRAAGGHAACGARQAHCSHSCRRRGCPVKRAKRQRRHRRRPRHGRGRPPRRRAQRARAGAAPRRRAERCGADGEVLLQRRRRACASGRWPVRGRRRRAARRADGRLRGGAGGAGGGRRRAEEPRVEHAEQLVERKRRPVQNPAEACGGQRWCLAAPVGVVRGSSHAIGRGARSASRAASTVVPPKGPQLAAAPCLHLSSTASCL